MCNMEEKKFKCLFTHAPHLEIVQDLSTETFLLTIHKFAARRSLSTTTISDNISTYLSAADDLKTLLQSPEVQRELGKLEVSWKFIPSGPHMHGWAGFGGE